MLNVVDRINKSSTPCIYRGEDCMDKFVEQLASIKDEILERMKENKPMIMLDEQELEFRNATRCSICNKHFKEEDKKVRDHRHFTGHYRGAAHEKCNLDYSFKFFKVPVFFHNLKNYDAHLIIEKANELNQELNPNICFLFVVFFWEYFIVSLLVSFLVPCLGSSGFVLSFLGFAWFFCFSVSYLGSLVDFG